MCVGAVLHTSLSGVIGECGAGGVLVLRMLIVCVFVCFKVFFKGLVPSDVDELNVRS